MEASPPPVPLSVEPVLGWRVWRLERRDDGSLTLLAVMRSDEWPAREAARARCHAHPGTPAPSGSCSCGLYAATSPEALAASQVFTGATSVVGAVAMWGTVVEHARGARAEISYPARLRLVVRAVPRRRARRDRAHLRRRDDAAGRGVPASRVRCVGSPRIGIGRAGRAAVDLRGGPSAAGARLGLAQGPWIEGESPTRRTSWSCSSSLLFQVVGFVINAVMALIILTSVLSMVLGVLAWIARRFS